MSAARFLLFALLAPCACSARASNADAAQDQANTSSVSTTVEAGTSDAGARTLPEAVDCNVLREQTLAILNNAIAEAPVACTSQNDCVLYSTRPKCVFDCGLSAVATDPTAIDTAVDRVDTQLCPDVCVQPPSSCGGGLSREYTPLARCVSGACSMQNWKSVFEPPFRDTVYPLFVDHCQDCHSGNQQGARGFANPDPFLAMLETGDTLNWQQNTHWFFLPDAQISSFVEYLETHDHHCWTDCAADAEQLRAALSQWAQDDP